MSDPTVALVGDGPPREAVEAALADGSASIHSPGIDGLGDAALGVVVGVSGSAGFREANRIATEARVPWLAVEIGGLGGHGVTTASVTAFGGTGPCYACLDTRIAAIDPTPTAKDPSRADARFAGAVAGHLATTHLGGSDVVGTVVEIPHTRRELLPVPTCPVCATSPDHGLTLSHRSVPLADTVEAAERAVDDRLGIVAMVGERESYPAPYYLAQLADTDAFSDVSVTEHAAGVAPDWDAAYVKAVGEALERYSAGVYRTDSFREAPATAVTNPVAPDRFVRPESTLSVPDTRAIQWLPATDLTERSPAHVPAADAVFPPPDEDIGPSITTGLGLGNSTVEAVLSGLYEVIERDATMLSWYSTYDPVGLRVADETVGAVRRRAAAEGLDATLVVVTQDIDVPVVAAMVTREEWPRFAAGSAASLDAPAAAADAFGEALQNWMELRALGPEDAAEAGTGVARYAENPHEVIDYFDVDTTVPATDIGPATVPSGEAELESVVSRVTDVDLTPYATRLTPRDVADIGFEAVRVLVPAAQPLFVEAPYFGDRARSVPRELGYRPRLDRGYHPYP
ncbi:MAG: YcaO-like family protein [Halobacteriaceae archaeon]